MTTSPEAERLVSQLRHDVDDVYELLDATNTTVNAIAETHGARLDRIETTLGSHGEKLDSHSKKLDSHGEKLNSHGEKLDSHGEKLDTILGLLEGGRPAA